MTGGNRSRLIAGLVWGGLIATATVTTMINIPPAPAVQVGNETDSATDGAVGPTTTAPPMSSRTQQQQQQQQQQQRAFRAGQSQGPSASRSVVVSSTGRVVGSTGAQHCEFYAKGRYPGNYVTQVLFVQGCISALQHLLTLVCKRAA